jgi:hypothetical protein
MMVYTGTSPRDIAIAAPDLIEWVPISPFSMLTLSLPTASTAASRAFTSMADVTCSMRQFLQTADTGVSSFAPGYPLILLTIAAQILTGQSKISPEAS